MRADDLHYRLRSVAGARWIVEVFDLASDPEERTNLYDATNPTHTEMKARLLDYKQRLVAGFESTAGGERRRSGRPLEADLEALRELGYVQ